MSFFSDLVIFMSETDIIHLFFPWLLLLAFTFGILQKYEFFEDEAVTGAISVSSSFLAIAGIYFFMPENIFANFGAVLAFATFASLGVLIVMAIAGVNIDDLDNRIGRIPLAVGLIVMGIGTLSIAAGALPVNEVLGNIGFNVDMYQDIFMPVMVFGFILAVIAITSR
ncbi:MAG: hypothetical protein R6V35_03110 [Candidatus Nanohaloarchaea archaeon]